MLLSGGQNEAGEEIFSDDVVMETLTPVNAYAHKDGYSIPELEFTMHSY